jgi:hypothetical protein
VRNFHRLQVIKLTDESASKVSRLEPSVKNLTVSLVLISCLGSSGFSQDPEPKTTPRQVRAVLDRVAAAAREHLQEKLDNRPARESRRKIRRGYGRRLDDWTYGALYTGMMAYLRLTDDEATQKVLLEVAEAEQYEPGSRLDPYHADDHAICQLYTELYFRTKDQELLAGTRKRF